MGCTPLASRGTDLSVVVVLEVRCIVSTWCSVVLSSTDEIITTKLFEYGIVDHSILFCCTISMVLYSTPHSSLLIMIFYVEMIGFNNATCSVSMSTSTTESWRVRVVETNGDQKKVTLQAFVDPALATENKCLGYMSTFYGNPSYPDACSTPPYGTGLFLNGTVGDGDPTSGPHVWTVLAVGLQGDFEVYASDMPESCARVLSLEGCQDSPSLTIKGSAVNQTYASWKLIKKYDFVPTASPSPAYIQGPVISGPNMTSFEYVNVSVEDIGGGNGCSVGSIVFTSTGSAPGSVPATVKVPVSALGKGVQVPVNVNGSSTIYAVGTCTGGGNTERSNELSVLYIAPDATNLPFTVTFSMVLGPGYSTSNPFNEVEKSKICSNLDGLVPGGRCTIEYMEYYSGSIQLHARQMPSYRVGITGTVAYSSKPSAEELQTTLLNQRHVITGALLSGLSNAPVGVDIASAILGTPPPQPVITSTKTTENSWQASWAGDGRYNLYLVGCNTVNVVGHVVSTPNLNWLVSGLNPSTRYYCFVIGVITDSVTQQGLLIPSNVTVITTASPSVELR